MSSAASTGSSTRSRVVITDSTFGEHSVEEGILRPLGCDVETRQCKTPAELIDATKDADYVITQFAPVKGDVINAMQRARIIVRYGIGVDNVDLDAARAKGIPVCNVPDYCISEVADHTLALLLTATRRITTWWDQIRQGKWGKGVAVTEMKTLRDLTVGVIGFGRIGRQVVERLRPFGCRILVSDPVVPADQIRAAGATAVSLEEIWKSSDVITPHCPSGPATRKIINAQSISQMKKGVILVNVGRGDLADPTAVTEALKSGQISIAALDVWDPEPLPADSPLMKMDNVIVTPHVASVSVKAVKTLRESVAQAVARVVQNQPLANVVNGVTTAPPARS